MSLNRKVKHIIVNCFQEFNRLFANRNFTNYVVFHLQPADYYNYTSSATAQQIAAVNQYYQPYSYVPTTVSGSNSVPPATYQLDLPPPASGEYES